MKDLRLSFINRILSSYTHEVRNYLAIIKETGGLMKDVIEIGKSRGADAKQFLGLIGSMEEQVARAAAITDYLHRFAHRMDCESAAANVNELIEELLALMTRIAYRRRISFERELRGGLPEAMLNPMAFHYLLFCIIDGKLSRIDRNGIIKVSTSVSDDLVGIKITSRGNAVQSAASTACSDEEISILATDLNADISESGDETTVRIPAAA
jgi:C4-dicarboxylate-specific signal transduction histidine kinase